MMGTVHAPRQLSDLESFGLIICGGEISKVAEILYNAVGERSAEGAEFVRRNVSLAPYNKAFVIVGRVIAIQFFVEVSIWPLTLRREALEVELDELRDALAVLTPYTIHNHSQEGIEHRRVGPKRRHFPFSGRE